MSMHGRLVLGAVALLLSGAVVLAQETAKPAAKETATFGALEAMPVETAKVKAAEWLKSVGKTDEASLKAFEAIWSADKTVLDKVTETFVLGNPAAAKLLAEARDPSAPAPMDVPALLKDEKNVFFRANLALAYAKALSNRRVYEEALDTLSLIKPEQVVDPSSFLFHKAVAEHAQLKKTEASKTIDRLLEDCPDAPERYKMVAALMALDMRSWKDEANKDLGWVHRMMGNIERRLDLSRGGPTTQDMQKRVLLTLDEMIKKMEEEQQSQCQGNCQGKGQGQAKGNKPNNTLQPSSPQQDSFGGNGGGPGQAEARRFKETTESWGGMPAKDRAKAALDLAREMPAKHRELIETYLKKLAQSEGK